MTLASDGTLAVGEGPGATDNGDGTVTFDPSQFPNATFTDNGDGTTTVTAPAAP